MDVEQIKIKSVEQIIQLIENKKFQEADKIVYDYKIRAIGSNIGIERFYLERDTTSIIEDLIQLSKPNINDKTLFVWPEGILPDITQDQLQEH